MYKDDDFTTLGLRVTKSGRFIWLRALKETAAFYGWDKAFPTLIKLKQETTGGGAIMDPGRRVGTFKGGRRHLICRDKSTAGWSKGLTNAFCVSGDATTRDLMAIAKATEVDWEWMTAKFGERRPKWRWMQTSPT